MNDEELEEILKRLGNRAFGRANWADGAQLLLEKLRREKRVDWEEHLAVAKAAKAAKAARDDGPLSEDTVLFLIAFPILLGIFEKRSGEYPDDPEEIRKLIGDDAGPYGMREVERGALETAPDEEARKEIEYYFRLRDKVCPDIFREYDEAEYAELYERDVVEFFRRYDRGYRELVGVRRPRARKADR